MRLTLFLVFTSLSLSIFSQNHPRTPDRDSIIMAMDSQFYKAARTNPDSAVILIKTVFPEYRNDVLISAWRNHYMGTHFYQRQNADSALFYFDKVMNKITGLDDAFLFNETKILSAMTFANTGRPNEAFTELSNAKEELDRNPEATDHLKVNLYRAFGVYHSNISEYESSMRNYLSALTIIEKDSTLHARLSAQVLINLGEVFIGMKDFQKAKEYLNEALIASEKFDKTFETHKSNIKLAEVAIESESLDAFNTDTLENAVAYFEKINALMNILEGKLYLGKILKHQGKISEAKTLLTSSLEVSNQIQLPIGIITASRNLGEIEQTKRNFSAAMTYYTSALQTAEKFSTLENRISILNNIASLEQEQQNYASAITTLREITLLKDSLATINDQKITKALEAQFQSEKKEQEISLLTSQNQLASAEKKNQRNLFIAGLVLTSLGAIFFFFQFRNRQKTTKKLQELDAAKSTFFANISHEFRTPLSLIKGPIEDQLQSSKLSPNDRKNLTVANVNTQRIASLVEQLLALSKLESGHLKLQVQPGSIDTFVGAQANTFSYIAQEKNINYTYSFDPHKEAWFDRDAMEKITANLLGNAFKYTPESGKISINGKAKEDVYILSIHNSGSTLTKEEQELIFTRFYQSNPNNPGSGIGLALTKELVVLHHGTITVNSTPDEETVFTITIPIKKTSYIASEILSEQLHKTFEPNTLEISNSSLEKTNTLLQNAPQLLIVEDNSEIRSYLTTLFEDIYIVHLAKNGIEGLELATSLIPDIIISDVMMPGKDGLSMASIVKNQELTAHIPIILLTAKTENQDKLKGMETGADAYLTKPFNSKLLSATVHNLLENRRKLQERFTQEVILTPKEIAVSSADELFLQRLQTVLDKELTNSEFSASSFCDAMGVSRMQLHRKLKALTGQSTSE
ncbi:MAG: response regulator, partial [Bacteroidetes bacterium]|nr:response regulator [Bacteroidota bacterium]